MAQKVLSIFGNNGVDFPGSGASSSADFRLPSIRLPSPAHTGPARRAVLQYHPPAIKFTREPCLSRPEPYSEQPSPYLYSILQIMNSENEVHSSFYWLI